MEGIALEMGVEAVKFAVDTLMQQLNEQKRLIGEAPSHVDELETDVKFLKDYVKEAVKQQTKSDDFITRALIREVGDSVYKAEDAIDSFVAEVAESESKCFSGPISKSKLAEIAQLINLVAETVKKVRKKVEQQINRTGDSGEDALGDFKGPPGITTYKPIFKEEEEILRNRLTREAAQPDVIFITGTHGIGKSMLAAKMFDDSNIRKHFTKHIWVGVSNPTPKSIYLAVLRQLDKLPDQGLISRNDWELSKFVQDCLEGETFLLVLDNVWEIEDWGRLGSAFGKSRRKSKVLITSTNDETARFILRDDSAIKLNPLSDEDSWSLLRLLVFGKQECPPQLENNGILIAANCNGLPQAIAFAGDCLARKDSKLYEMSKRKMIWQELSGEMISYTSGVVSSYSNLPYHLRACFLYLGIFPKWCKFSVSKLILMWIAEGFVRPCNGAAPEKTAQGYLTNLIDSNLVEVEEVGLDGLPKTCSMNALLYDFCKTEAGNERENFLQEFKKCDSDGAFDPPIDDVKKLRRVSIHAHISNFIPKFISSKSRHDSVMKIRLRSFVSHSKEVFTLHSGDISSIRAAFKLLRVLDARPIEVNKIHSDLCLLVHLRYVTLSLKGGVLPADIAKLRNMQTLIVHTMSRALKVEADILKMDELRHFKTNASATLPKKSKASEKDERLQTLCGISPRSCTEEFFKKTPNLKKLVVRGQLAPILDGKNELLRTLVKVEKLKLLNDTTCSKEKYDGNLCCLPQFPPNLRSLTLSSTFLNMGQLSILGSLQNLEELKLKDNAFVGNKLKVSDKDFLKLQTLQIESLHFREWESSSGQFPQLRRLMLSECKQLREIPVELADIRSFQKLDLHNCKASAADSARSIFKVKIKMKQTDYNIVFDLSISPECPRF